ncbi:DciA family protein [Kingella negevensis]|uniref:Zn-ribbon-containing, possibly RNA-binding protein and truncated derivatives n=1 Tax=Kingella negevensis TaxID=1522312 RepID=A0A238HDN8_9NEIS|nr:DciA family protein [Kingella negevensis]MDK4683790.1 DciA family protein [Kingella negevensis]MDK4697102.1 DciA family protein [Kingella negevensis]MDK4708290.1 DciA family protein [Kingella negevensis]MDK4709126.1 DciA family protein [Kingella negevensis]SNB51395.1 Uncharacterised protein [Kingella negevensis]
MQLDKIASHNPQLNNLLQLSRYWQQLDTQIKRLLPANLHPHFHIVCIEQDTLIIHASAPMAASRLKMLMPTLLPQIQKINQQIGKIQIKNRPKNTTPTPPKNFHISPKSLSYFEQTAQQLSHHPELAQAMQKLVEHNR